MTGFPTRPPVPSAMPGADEALIYRTRRQCLDDLVDDTLHVYRRFRVGHDVDAALTLTDITLNRKDHHV